MLRRTGEFVTGCATCISEAPRQFVTPSGSSERFFVDDIPTDE